MTQLEMVKAGIISPQMTTVAQREGAMGLVGNHLGVYSPKC